MNFKAILASPNFHKAMVFIGVMGTFITIIMGWGGMQFLLRAIVKKMIRLVPGSITWAMWKTIPIPVYLKFYLFNITNAEDFNNGEKAILRELGPYTYTIDYDKHKFIPNDGDDTYLYQDSRAYIFEPDLSSGRETDMITYVNFIFLGVSNMANTFIKSDSIQEALNNKLIEKGEKLYRSDRVRDLLFRGVPIQPYVELADEPMLQEPEAAKFHIPDDFMDGKFAMFKGKNGTLDAWWEVHTGVRDYKEFGKIKMYQNKTKLTNHKHAFCNMINGTDGTLYPPFVEPGETDVYIFWPELCRSIKWKFERDRDTQGVPVARFRFPDIKTPKESPNMWCFCPYSSVEECNVHGIGTLAQCYQGFPLLYSKPHLLEVDKNVRKLVTGLRPDKDKHAGYIDLHKMTGTIVEASVTMQWAIHLKNIPTMPTFQNISPAYIPILWSEQSQSLDTLNRIMVKFLSTFLALWPFIRWLNLFGCLGLVSLGGLLVFMDRKAPPSVVGIEEEEEEEEEVPDGEVDQELNMWIKKFVK